MLSVSVCAAAVLHAWLFHLHLLCATQLPLPAQSLDAPIPNCPMPLIAAFFLSSRFSSSCTRGATIHTGALRWPFSCWFRGSILTLLAGAAQQTACIHAVTAQHVSRTEM